jgi:predicted RNA polymerase sigma factor
VQREKIAMRKDPFVWMMVVAKNIALKMLRREKKDRKVSIDELRIVPHSQEIEADL